MAWYTGYPPDFTDKGDKTSVLLQKHINEFSRLYGILSDLMNPLDGHSHSGGADQGPQITSDGIADRAVTRSKLAVGAAVGAKGTPAGKTDTIGYTFESDGNTGLFAEGSTGSSGSDLVLRTDGNQILKLKNIDKKLYDNGNVQIANLNDVYNAIANRDLPGAHIVDDSMPWAKAETVSLTGSKVVSNTLNVGAKTYETTTNTSHYPAGSPYRLSVGTTSLDSGVATGNYKLQQVIQALVDLSHTHHTHLSIYDCNCNCDCSGGCT